MNGLSIGVDFGNSKICVASYYNGKSTVLKNKENEKLTPSFLFFINKTTALLGTRAREMAEKEPELGIFDIKRFIGTNFDDDFITKYQTCYPFTIEADAFNKCAIKLSEKTAKTPHDLCFLILRQLKIDSEEVLGDEIRKLVLTIPPYFTEKQKEIFLASARRAGFYKVELISEPVAILRAYFSRNGIYNPHNCQILICDLGGSSFDISVVKMKAGNAEICLDNSHKELGGMDFDILLVNHICDRLQTEHNFDPRNDKYKMCKLLPMCENVKKQLSKDTKVDIIICGIVGSERVHLTITREDFEEMISLRLQKYLEKIDDFMRCVFDKNLEIREVLVAGGSAKIPRIRDAILKYFRDFRVNFLVKAEQCAAEGAAIYAATIFRKNRKVNGNFAKSPGSLNCSGAVNVRVPKPKKNIFGFPSRAEWN